MISIVNYLHEFHGLTDDMAFDAAKHIAKSRMSQPYDPENGIYRAQQAVKKAATRVVTPNALSDEDKLKAWRGKGDSLATKLLKRRDQ